MIIEEQCKSQDIETTQMSINKCMNKKVMAHMYIYKNCNAMYCYVTHIISKYYEATWN